MYIIYPSDLCIGKGSIQALEMEESYSIPKPIPSKQVPLKYWVALLGCCFLWLFTLEQSYYCDSQ